MYLFNLNHHINFRDLQGSIDIHYNDWIEYTDRFAHCHVILYGQTAPPEGWAFYHTREMSDYLIYQLQRNYNGWIEYTTDIFILLEN